MTEGLLKFRDRIARKAIQYYKEEQTEEVTFEQFHFFINYKIGTEIHEDFVREAYKYFLEKREQKRIEKLNADKEN
jgi:hypothetical protein